MDNQTLLKIKSIIIEATNQIFDLFIVKAPEPIKKQFASMEEYWGSEEWKVLRQKVKERCNGICEVCNTNKMFAAHHLHYRNLYNEKLEDLQGVCRECHDKVHGDRGKNNYYSQSKEKKFNFNCPNCHFRATSLSTKEYKLDISIICNHCGTFLRHRSNGRGLEFSNEIIINSNIKFFLNYRIEQIRIRLACNKKIGFSFDNENSEIETIKTELLENSLCECSNCGATVDFLTPVPRCHKCDHKLITGAWKGGRWQ